MTKTTRNIVRVRCVQDVEIDLTMWGLNYGTDETVPEIREQVKQTADEVVKEHFSRVGVLKAEVE